MDKETRKFIWGIIVFFFSILGFMSIFVKIDNLCSISITDIVLMFFTLKGSYLGTTYIYNSTFK